MRYYNNNIVIVVKELKQITRLLSYRILFIDITNIHSQVFI